MNIEKLEEIAKAATPGPWMLATSNSWRRFVTRFDTRNVCEPVTYSERDRHPDLHFPNGGADGPDAQFMAAFSPREALALLAVVRAANPLLMHLDRIGMTREEEPLMNALGDALRALEEME